MKSTDPIINHNRKAAVRNTTVSPSRLAIEDYMKANLLTPITAHQAAVLAGVSTQRGSNILSQLRTDGLVRHVGEDGQSKTYVWKTSPLRNDPQRPAGATPPRQVDVMRGHYNGAELRPYNGRPGAMDAYRLPSRGMRA